MIDIDDKNIFTIIKKNDIKYTNNNINYVNTFFKKCLLNYKQSIINNFNEEIKNTDDNELKEMLILKLSDIIESDIKIIKINNNLPSKCPTNPVHIRGTNLYLKNMTDINVYKKFCLYISNTLGFLPDFSDSQFSYLPITARIYEAIKILHFSFNLTQKELNKIVTHCENTI